MFEITRTASFSAAHALRGYEGPCARLHGHNWKVEAVIRSPGLNSSGMVVDFVDLGRIMDEVLRIVDHRNLNDLPPFTEVNPTSENVAAWFFQELGRRLLPFGAAPHRVRVWELPDCSAAYWKD